MSGSLRRWSPWLPLGVALVLTACSSGNGSMTGLEEIGPPGTESSVAGEVDEEPGATPTNSPTPTDAAVGTATGAPATAPTGAPADAGALGVVEVAEITRLPRRDVAWETTELVQPTTAVFDIGFAFVGELGDELVAVARTWPESGDGALYTWRSADGVTWTMSETTLPAGHGIDHVVAFEQGLLAIGLRFDQADSELVAWLLDDSTWRSIDFRAGGIDPTGLMVTHLAGGDGVVAGGQLVDTTYRPPTTDIETQGHRIALDDWNGTYEVTELATGEVVAAGSMDDIYPWHEGGQTIWDLATREPLTIIPWEVWEQGSGRSSPLPIPVPDPDLPGPSEVRTVDWDGFTVVVDHEVERFEVTMTATGELVTSGSMNDFYRGPSPWFFDDTTGEVVVSLTWEEWDLFLHDAHQIPSEPPEVHPARLVTLHSADGSTWTQTDHGPAQNRHIGSLTATADGFDLVLVDHATMDVEQARWSSADGVAWTSEGAATDSGPGYFANGPAGAIGLQWDAFGAGQLTIVTSDDGADWSPAFSLARQSDGRMAHVHLVASGTNHRAALATLSEVGPPPDLTITVGDTTARFPDMAGVEIVDTETGDVLLFATSEELANSAASIATYADGVTTFWADGEPILRIDDATVEAAYADQQRDHEERTDHVVLVEEDGEWYEVSTPRLGPAWPNHLAVVDDLLVIVAVDYGGDPNPLPTPPTLRIHVGALAAVPG